jgi:adenine phosphoribosyltransferase
MVNPQNSLLKSKEYYDLDFYGLKRKLRISYLSPTLKIANFSILGDVEFTEKAGEIMHKQFKQNNIMPDCFVSPEVKIVPFVHHLAKRFGHKRYVICRKSVKGYMTTPIVEIPQAGFPHHVKKIIINFSDYEYLNGKKVVIVDDVVSTGYTISLLENAMKKLNAEVLTRCSIFKQGDSRVNNLIYLAKLPIIIK